MLINIGSAEGYYAVGLARRLPRAAIYAFDRLEGERARCRELADLNGVSARLHLGGALDAEAFSQLPLDQAAIVCDCEGDEVELFNDSLLPRLATASMLIETHTCYRPGCTRLLAERLRPSHAVTVLREQPRRAGRIPGLRGWGADEQALAMDEGRLSDPAHPQEWIWAVPREGTRP